MKTRAWVLVGMLVAAGAAPAGAADWFVATNGSDAAAGTNWATAKLTIQSGVDAAAADDVVWVSNGTYVGLATVNKGIAIRSVNGPEVTTIQGSASRCVTMSNAAAIVAGFTLTGGTADWGGGAYIVSGALEDCVIRNNTADGRNNLVEQETAYGGGVYGGTLRRCIVAGNLATAYGSQYYRPLAQGGGTYNANLYDCLVVSNEAHSRFGWVAGDVTAGGGVSGGSARNCTIIDNLVSLDYLTEPGTLTGGGSYGTALRNSIVYYNVCRYEGMGLILSNVSGGSATNSCAPDIATGHGNLNGEPLFVDSGSGNYRLATNSPCRDAGNNAFVAGATDLDGQPRIANGTVDMGAYEVQPGGGGGAWYVATNGNDAAAGTNWATAKLTIQAGVDAASAGDTVWVSNGTYATGGRTASGSLLTNRVTIDKPIVVQSVHGPEATIIQGAGGWLADDAVRCVHLGTNATLIGFTLTNGQTRMYSDNSGAGIWSEASGVISNCTVTGNTAFYGGGANGGTLFDCLLAGNEAEEQGGGARQATLVRCVVRDNFVDMAGGGASGCALADCALIGNVCGAEGGGGADYCTLVNCTVVSNRGNFAGGVYGGEVVNSVVYGNLPTNVPNHANAAFSYSCTTPAPVGPGNVAKNPQFVDAGAGNYRLQAGSPCINAGDNAAVVGDVDLDGNPRIALGSPYGRVDMGAYEFASQVRYVATNGSDAADGMSWASAKQTIQAAVDSAGGGDMVWVSNGVYATGGRAVYGGMTNRVAIDRPIAVQSVNGPTATILRGGVATRCAYVGTNATLSGFTLTNGATWNVEFAEHERGKSGGGAWAESSGVLSNCVLSGNSAESYGGGAYGGTLRNCTLKGNTASWGGGAHGATLWDCAVSGNSVTIGGSGGGVNSCTANLCDISGNMADVSGGGGAFESTLNNCLVAGNLALLGGGMYASTANSCTIVGNWAGSGFPGDGTGGGGSAEGTLVNCIVFGNGATAGSNYLGGTFQNSCTAPHPGGTGNIASYPQFVDAGSGNYRLQATSPCLDAGDNGVVTWAEDLDGNPRIAFGAVDMGAYEAQLAGVGAWFGAITNGLTNDLDCAAGDGMPNLLKYATGGSPRVADDNACVGWARDGIWPILTFHRNPSATDVRFVVESAETMASGATWRGVATNVGGSWLGATNVEESGTGNPVECAVTDPVALDSNRFLRLRVSRP